MATPNPAAARATLEATLDKKQLAGINQKVSRQVTDMKKIIGTRNGELAKASGSLTLWGRKSEVYQSNEDILDCYMLQQ